MMGKNVLLIGASGDIGVAIAEELVKDGYHILLHYHQNRNALERFKERFGSENVLGEIQANLSTKAGIDFLIENLFFEIDVVIFASGAAYFGLFQDMTNELMDQMLTLHVKAPLLISQHILPGLIQKRSGKIIFITSIWGNIGASHEVMYSTVKGAQNSFIKSLAKEVAMSGVSVNGVSPGFIETKMNGHLIAEEREAIISDIPMNRAGTTKEVAHTVQFLLNEKASYIQGEIIKVTGGW